MNQRPEIQKLLATLIQPPTAFVDALTIAHRLHVLRMSFAVSAPCADEITDFAAGLSSSGSLNGCKDWSRSLAEPLVIVLGGAHLSWGDDLRQALSVVAKDYPQPEAPRAPETQRSEAGLMDVADDEPTDITANPFAGVPVS
jgi:hypothetical protein